MGKRGLTPSPRPHAVSHEGATSTAFQNLLAATAKKAGWHLVPQLSTRIRGRQVRPDGTLRDEYNLHHGYWEAKDSSDKLDVEIRKKIALGYPLSNTIFEDTTTAVLYQNGGEVEPRFDRREPRQICDLLNQFYSHVEPDIEGFEVSVDEIRETPENRANYSLIAHFTATNMTVLCRPARL